MAVRQLFFVSQFCMRIDGRVARTQIDTSKQSTNRTCISFGTRWSGEWREEFSMDLVLTHKLSSHSVGSFTAACASKHMKVAQLLDDVWQNW